MLNINSKVYFLVTYIPSLTTFMELKKRDIRTIKKTHHRGCLNIAKVICPENIKEDWWGEKDEPIWKLCGKLFDFPHFN